MADLFKFRCSECAKLLGISPRQAGRLIHCPRCRTELIVPRPGEEAESEPSSAADDSDEISDLGIDLGFTSILTTWPAAPRAESIGNELTFNAAEVIESLRRLAERDASTPEKESVDDNPDAEPEIGEVALIATKQEPLIPKSRRLSRHQNSFDRRRDVVLPRTAVIAWSMFVLAALALSFIAGLLVGHYRWR